MIEGTASRFEHGLSSAGLQAKQRHTAGVEFKPGSSVLRAVGQLCILLFLLFRSHSCDLMTVTLWVDLVNTKPVFVTLSCEYAVCNEAERKRQKETSYFVYPCHDSCVPSVCRKFCWCFYNDKKSTCPNEQGVQIITNQAWLCSGQQVIPSCETNALPALPVNHQWSGPVMIYHPLLPLPERTQDIWGKWDYSTWPVLSWLSSHSTSDFNITVLYLTTY